MFYRHSGQRAALHHGGELPKKDDQGIQQGKRTCGIFAGSADCPPASLYKKEEDHQWGDLHQQDRKTLGSYRNLADDETIVRKGRSRPEKSVK